MTGSRTVARRVARRAGAVACPAAAWMLAAAAAHAQQPPPGPSPAAVAPSLQIVSARLGQVGDGDDLRLRLRFSRDLPVRRIEPSRARFVCLVLGPGLPTQRRVCVSRRDGGGLRASMTSLHLDGRPRTQPRELGRASVQAAGEQLVVRAPLDALRVKPGTRISWRAFVTWHDGGPCEAVAVAERCTQTWPAAGNGELRIRKRRRPAFVREGRLRLLATGDSTIQIIDSLLEQRLERRRATRVRSDARISTGVSKPFMLDWVKRAREQARSLHPDVTVISIGANDGFPMKTRTGASAGCCGAAWTREYARRVEAMMRSYRRGGRSYVYWMTLPAPRRGDFARVYRAVNRAIVRAAQRVGRGVRVIDLVKVFTPGGHFRQYVRFRGRRVNARQPDGVHLSVAGAKIAATLVVDRLQADGALTRLRRGR